LLVPDGYVSGSALSGTAIWDAFTIASLGLTPGTYTYTWGTGAHTDNFTINIGAVPEPSSLVMAGAAMLAGVGAWARRPANSRPGADRSCRVVLIPEQRHQA
jgi:hypothetical protein